jgi:hypothetical protein
MTSRRCQMGMVEGAWPLGIWRLARQIAQQMREAYGDDWHTAADLDELACLILGLQLSRAGVNAELREGLDLSPRVMLGEWIVHFASGQAQMQPCPSSSQRRRFGRQMVERIDTAAATSWAADHGMRALGVPVLDVHLLNRHRSHALVIPTRVRQTALRVVPARAAQPWLPG